VRASGTGSPFISHAQELPDPFAPLGTGGSNLDRLLWQTVGNCPRRRCRSGKHCFSIRAPHRVDSRRRTGTPVIHVARSNPRTLRTAGPRWIRKKRAFRCRALEHTNHRFDAELSRRLLSLSRFRGRLQSRPPSIAVRDDLCRTGRAGCADGKDFGSVGVNQLRSLRGPRFVSSVCFEWTIMSSASFPRKTYFMAKAFLA